MWMRRAGYGGIVCGEVHVCGTLRGAVTFNVTIEAVHQCMWTYSKVRDPAFGVSWLDDRCALTKAFTMIATPKVF